MEANLQHQIAFFLTGRRVESSLQPFDSRFRPSLLSRYRDLTSLRYDFPVVLNHEGGLDRTVLSLTRLVDDAVGELDAAHDRDRIARHGYRLERELRRDLAGRGTGDFCAMWHAAAARLATDDTCVQDSAKRLWTAFRASGDLVDVDSALPSRVVTHAWSAVQAEKAKAFRQRAERLLLKLRDVLAAELVGSAAGRTPERLRASVGSPFADTFDFGAMSHILVGAMPSVELSEDRRERIRGLIDVLERQRFYPMGEDGPEGYGFAFDRCSDALEAYQARHAESVELAKALAVAELEANGDYRESTHNVLFEGYGSNGLDADALAQLPDYLVCADARTLDPAETAQIVELLAAGLPIKVLVQTDDVLEQSAVAEGHVALGLRARQLVDTAIGLTDVFVFQATASHLFRRRDSLMRGLERKGPALFSVFSGANGHTGELPAYLVAAAAMESRVFPFLVYDPSGGPDWATRLTVDDNPEPEEDWPVHRLTYEDERLQAQSEDIAITAADFMALGDRFFQHYAIVPRTDWTDALVSVQEALDADVVGLPKQVPCISVVDDVGRLHRAVLDDRTLQEARRCRTMWHSLQELGGIHNSHAERLIAEERRARTATASLQEVPEPLATAMPAEAQAPAPEMVAEESHGDDPYIETARCTTCNECTQINNKMFAYNADKQAYIADADAGTFRQLVEAAEGCQVSIIHPGKPRNPKEPGLDDLIKRAALFV